MPILRQHKSTHQHYVLTSIGSKVITFQVTSSGVAKLRTAGITADRKFRRSLLFALYREGELHTATSGKLGAEDGSEPQTEFDFADDVTGETRFPACDCCGQIYDLSFITATKGQERTGEVACSSCFTDYGLQTDFREPLPPRNIRELLERLATVTSGRKQPNAAKLEHILRASSI